MVHISEVLVPSGTETGGLPISKPKRVEHKQVGEKIGGKHAYPVFRARMDSQHCSGPRTEVIQLPLPSSLLKRTTEQLANASACSESCRLWLDYSYVLQRSVLRHRLVVASKFRTTAVKKKLELWDVAQARSLFFFCTGPMHSHQLCFLKSVFRE